MDTIQEANKKRKRLESGLEKSSPVRPITDSKKDELSEDEIEVNGKIIKMADDLKSLPEIDYQDPKIKKQLEQEDAEFCKRHPNLTYEEAERMINKRINELTE